MRIFYTCLIVAGIGLSLFTALLSITLRDCGIGDCASVIEGTYGRIAGVPVGLYAFSLWAVLCVSAPVRWLTYAARGALVLGSVYFVGLQAFVLEQFCGYCLAHAALCFALLAVPPGTRPFHEWGYVGVLGAFTAFLLLEWRDERMLQRPATATNDDSSIPAPPEPEDPEANPVEPEAASVRGTPFRQGVEVPEGLPLPWISSNPYEGRSLVVNLYCRKCLAHLETLRRMNLSDEPAAPLIWKTTAQSRAPTVVFVAAVLSGGEDVQTSFDAAFAALAATPDWFMASDTTVIERILRVRFPQMDAFVDDAERLVAAHEAFIDRYNITVTPTLIVGSTVYRGFPLEETFAQ